MNPYRTFQNEIYFTDGVAEVLVDTFDSHDITEKVSKLLNNTYKEAYEDGMNASLHEKHKELIITLTSLTIENMKLRGRD